MYINREQILKSVNDGASKRGLAYFNNHRVISLDIDFEDETELNITSIVQGSGRHTYQQEISISTSLFGILIDAYCSCPVGHNCKHVVAACLQYEQEFVLTQNKGAACLNWLDQFSRSFNQAPPPAPKQDFIVYVLHPCSSSGKISVNFHITRILKNGGLGKGRAINASHIFNHYNTPACVQDQDVVIGQLLQANNELYSESILIQGELGFHSLNKMLPTGRCFWEDHQRPALQNGEQRKLSTHWEKQANGSMKLQLSIAPSGILLLTEPALYVDIADNLIGPLAELDYTSSQLQALLTSPSIPEELIPQFSQQVVERVPTSILPPPQPVEIEEITDQQPIPCLQLSAKGEGEDRFHLMRLRFRYGEHELSVLPEKELSSLVVDKKLLRIHRKLDAEDRYTEELVALGFEGRGKQQSNDIFFLSFAESIIESTNRWHDFITETLPQLQQQGWLVDIDADFNMQFHQAEQWNAEVKEQGNDWFDLHFDIEVNNKSLPLLPLISQVLEHYEPDQLPESLTLNLGDGQYLNISSSQIKPILEILYELYDRDSLTHDGALKLSRFDAGRLEDLEQQNISNLQWRGGDHLRQLGQQLKSFSGIKAVQPPHGLAAELRPYQQQGLNWLQFLREYQLSGILADDMGLGKTVQTLAHLLLEKEQGRLQKPCLIVAPTSLMSNWRREAEQFTPALKVLVLQGPERHQFFDQINDYDLVLSTYPLLVRDEDVLLAVDYHTVVLDEAQTVKNPKAKAAKMIRKITTEHRLCLTGTPMENHLGELWALFDFLMPGFLGDLRQFNTLFRTPIEKHADNEQRQRLVSRISPFMLRRAKGDVLKELPEKTEIIHTISLDKKQAALYESIRISMEEKVRKTIANKGLARSHITILDALLKLRQVCCDPRLLPLKQAQTVKQSAKLELLMQMLPEMIEEGRRILIFSQFTKMLALIEAELISYHISYSKLTGQTRNRDAAIERFKQGEANVFLISLKAGGVGLNLTEADTVIHYDPWWNPATENQATDRAHRMGQSKSVFVYKLVVENSVEEKIVAMQHKKKALADGVYQQEKQENALTITADSMQQLFAPL
ncbi:MAG: SNF2-related protein [Mariprofundaceae bacterium]